MGISWNNSMSVSNDAIDDDHQNLIRIFNNIDECLEPSVDFDTLKGELSELEKYTKEHFLREEMLMKKVNYPNKYQHFKLHHDLSRQLQTFLNEIPNIDEHSKGFALEDSLINMLRHWLLDHVLQEDLKIKPYLSQFPRDLI